MTAGDVLNAVIVTGVGNTTLQMSGQCGFCTGC